MIHEASLELTDRSVPFGIDAVELAERGLPTSAVADLRELGLSFTEVAEVVISPRTLKHRVARGENLSSVETDRLLRVRRILALATRLP